MVSAIVSVDNEWGIGKDNRLLLSPSEDMDFFQFMTKGQICIMGKTTWETLNSPLKSRCNIILTHNTLKRNIQCSGDATIVFLGERDINLILQDTCNKKEIFIIGGEQIYKKYLDYCERVYVTKIYKSFGADKFFPNLDLDKNWKIVAKSKEKQWTDSIRFQFFKYERRDNKYDRFNRL